MERSRQEKVDVIINTAYFGTFLLLVFVALKVMELIFPFLIAMALVVLLNPLVQVIYRKLKRGKRAISVGVMALLYLCIGFFIVVVVIQVVFLMEDLFTELPAYYNDVISPFLYQIEAQINLWAASLSPAWEHRLGHLSSGFSDGIETQIVTLSSKGITAVTNFIGDIPGFFITLLLIILLSFYISWQYDQVAGFLKSYLPRNVKPQASAAISLLKRTVVKYFKAAFILMIITFIELFIGFLILGVGNPVGKAAGIAVFDMLPIFGCGGIIIPWILFEVLRLNFAFAGSLAILYVAVILIRQIIEPKVVSDQLGLNPIITLLAVYVGFRLFGVLGMITFPILAQVLFSLHQNGYFGTRFSHR